MGIPINPPGKYLGSPTKIPSQDRFEEFFCRFKQVNTLFDEFLSVFLVGKVNFYSHYTNKNPKTIFCLPSRRGETFFADFFAAELHIVIQAIAHLDTSWRILTLVKRTQQETCCLHDESRKYRQIESSSGSKSTCPN